MSGFKKILIVVLLVIIMVSAAAGFFYHTRNFVMIDFKFYPKNAERLDFRGTEITIKQYETFRTQLPECEILWKVSFQGEYYPEETKSLTVSQLSQTDVNVLDYFPQLEKINADGCKDYDILLLLQEKYPDLEVRYNVMLGENSYAPDTEEVTITAIGEEEISLLQYLPQMKSVIIAGGGNMENLETLRTYCYENGCNVRFQIGDVLVEDDVQALTVSGMKQGEEDLLLFLPNLRQLHLLNPEISAESLKAIETDCPNVELSWNREVCGKLFSSTDTKIDISGIAVTDMDALAEQMTYFPKAEKLIMSDCGVDNETMAAYREEHRGEYKVVWTVQLGDHLTARTDDTTFMPTREGVYYFQDHESGNLKYCEDMVCIDVGHMAIHDISFVAYMPNLQYLVLAHTEVRDITPLENCKKLVFLELDWSTVRDFTPLLGCTALEDLNIGKTYPDVEPLTQMTWLKNLWMVDRGSAAYPLTQALTDTKIVTSGSATVAGGWRDLPNYYAMRDLLGMPYMTW